LFVREKQMGRVPMSLEEFVFWGKVRRGEIKLYRKETWSDRHPLGAFLIWLSITLSTLGFILCIIPYLD
jgi:hypothetical protein